MNGLYVIFYEDQEGKTHTENIYANTLIFCLEQFNQIMQVKGIKKPKIKRMTEYQKVAVVQL
jgi:hypothetical protein